MVPPALSESGLVDTLEPSLLVVCIMFKQALQRMSKHRAVLRWEVLWASMQFLPDLPVHHGNILLQEGKLCFMEDLVPMLPLLVCQLMQLLVKDVVPSPEGAVNVVAPEVALLGGPPLLNRETLHHVLPSQAVLGL